MTARRIFAQWGIVRDLEASARYWQYYSRDAAYTARSMFEEGRLKGATAYQAIARNASANAIAYLDAAQIARRAL